MDNPQTQPHAHIFEIASLSTFLSIFQLDTSTFGIWRRVWCQSGPTGPGNLA
jgi:hypothetical protein